MRTNPVRVPAFVRFVTDMISEGYKAMEFYAFDELIHPSCTVKRGTSSAFIDEGIIDDSFRKLPFTVLNSCPEDCSIVSVRDQIYIIGGSMLSKHERLMVSSWAASGVQFEQISQLLNEEAKNYLARYIPIRCLDRCLDECPSKRVKRFQYQKFLDSLPKNNQKGKILVGELDEDASNDSPTFWETCPSMSKGRRRAHVLHLGDKLYAIGGTNNDGEQTPLVEVFDQAQGAWTPVCSENPPDIHPNYLVSAAIKETNTILIGSNDSFYSLEVEHVGNGSVEGRWKRELHKCPSDLIDVCFFEPGLTNKHYVLWYTRGCIYGLDLISYKYFTVDLADLAYNVDWCHPKLVDLGAGILSLIYTGSECVTSIDDHGVEHDLIDHHCITFEINYDRLDKIESNMPFPGIELQKTVVSRYKCYAPGVEYIYQLGSAFAMDIPFPHEKKVHL